MKAPENNIVPPIPVSATAFYYGSGSFISQFTDRELQVLVLLIQGNTNKQIAKALFISTETVKFHVNNLYRKTKVSSRTALTYAAFKSLLHPKHDELDRLRKLKKLLFQDTAEESAPELSTIEYRALTTIANTLEELIQEYDSKLG